jgi:hypothetical protein
LLVSVVGQHLLNLRALLGHKILQPTHAQREREGMCMGMSG